ncbi:hypothetical protein IE53DRAFT_408460 [Violaceomyces palustris]|uniref:Uncharacterized protein n=1 Tax=Violaceomyces palustris TaxID=1673888 RepID=A0ACD0P6M8_9BASI|nr:hypothetical protein IE53DRAFT_408460 [Violaceomyces palustris]
MPLELCGEIIWLSPQALGYLDRQELVALNDHQKATIILVDGLEDPLTIWLKKSRPVVPVHIRWLLDCAKAQKVLAVTFYIVDAPSEMLSKKNRDITATKPKKSNLASWKDFYELEGSDSEFDQAEVEEACASYQME